MQQYWWLVSIFASFIFAMYIFANQVFKLNGSLVMIYRGIGAAIVLLPFVPLIQGVDNPNFYYLCLVQGVLIAYASVYGGTENAANILACKLAEQGIPVDMYDVSITHPSDVLSEAFKYSQLVFASTTYNNGIFVTMENLLRDIAHHGLKNRKVAFIQNGSWAPSSGKLMTEIINSMKDMEILEAPVTLKSTLAPGQEEELETLSKILAASVQGKTVEHEEAPVAHKGFVCKICGFIYEGDTLPEDYVCPICRRPASDFEPLS